MSFVMGLYVGFVSGAAVASVGILRTGLLDSGTVDITQQRNHHFHDIRRYNLFLVDLYTWNVIDRSRVTREVCPTAIVRPDWRFAFGPLTFMAQGNTHKFPREMKTE